MNRLVSGTGAALLALVPALAAQAGDCTGHVVDVRPVLQYDHMRGEGFLAVRAGPGAGFEQTGELYRGDEIAVHDRQGNWYAVTCMAGQCMEPLWGPPMPGGWVYGRYLRLGGVCP
ncbi:MAG: SH3 domain-containing protein [Rubellimicrobium sp.]|nr:SH3 domain-containing protein [Rubellimicrobium sp.]